MTDVGQTSAMTPRDLSKLLGSALLAGGVLLAILAVVLHYTIETDVLFFDDLGNEVHYHSGRDVTFLLFSLAGFSWIVGGFLIVGARRLSRERGH